MSDRRLIEVAFPLEQASIDSVHEKNVRHGHISTLHIWPARRPLAASRAALIATLLPDPGTPEKRRELTERLGGRVVKVLKKKQGPGGGEEKIVKETVGGILHWGRETENRADVDFFRQEIRKAYGRAPRVLDPFAGGGAIPLEAMRLGCDVTAIDINPVAWFILKCTLEYPQKLAGQERPLPDFVRGDRAFMEAFFKAQGMKGAMLRSQLTKLGLDGGERTTKDGNQASLELEIEEHTLDADLAWHVRAWGWWVLREARRELAQYYPVYADWQPRKDIEAWRKRHLDDVQPMQLVPVREDGKADIAALNNDLSRDVLDDERRPRWVPKPAVAYLWARTVTCKHCRATIPLLKTRWLAKKDKRRVLLTMVPNADKTGVTFGIEKDVAVVGGNNAQRREQDKRGGQGTMSRSGAWCPCCGRPGTVSMSSADLRAEANAGRMGSCMTAVVIDVASGKEFRRPSAHELTIGAMATLGEAESSLPFGLPKEPIPQGGSRSGGGSPFTVHLYGFRTWASLFSARQLRSLTSLAQFTRTTTDSLRHAYAPDWAEAIHAGLAITLDRQADRLSTLCKWDQGRGTISNTFSRFALPILWDFAEANPLGDATGNWSSCVEWVAGVIEHAQAASNGAPPSTVKRQSALEPLAGPFDAIVTDPPYYDAIPYSDLMDFFYVWLRRTTNGMSASCDEAFSQPLGPKWDRERRDGELIDDASRQEGSAAASKAVYEDGMSRVFASCSDQLKSDGRLVVVFANKQPAAWETLVAAIVRAGFMVTGSWPIRTEMGNRQRALTASALASSVWLVCKKRPLNAQPGWDNRVLQEMRENIGQQLRDFWDAGIQGPDFVWAATGPAMEAFSKHPIVKKANAPGETMSVGEFLKAVRRIVVEFVVGRVLGEAAHVSAQTGDQAAAGLDDVTTYYLLHRHDFGMNDAPAGACILYALSCNLSEGELADRFDLLLRTGGVSSNDEGEPDEGDADAEGDAIEGSGSTFKLKPWKQRRRPSMGIDPIAEQARDRQKDFEARGEPLWEGAGPQTVAGRRVVPLIDAIHRLMHLWTDGEVTRVDDYLDGRGLRRSETFRQVLQALIELAEQGSEERAVLEGLSNHVRVLGERADSLFDASRN